MLETENTDYRTHFFETSPIPVVILDGTSFTIIDINPAAVTSLGYPSHEAALGRSPMDFSAAIQYDGTPSEDKAFFYVKQALEGGSSFFEWRCRHPDGTFWDAEGHMHRFYIQNQLLLQFSYIDVTQRKNHERLQQLLRDLIFELNSCTDIHEGFAKVLDAVLHLECIDCGSIYEADHLGNSLNAVVHAGLSQEAVNLTSHIDLDAPDLHVLLKGESRYGSYMENDNVDDPIRSLESIHSYAMIPVMAQGKLIALMNLASHTSTSIPMVTKTALETIAYQLGSTLLRLETDAALRETEEIFKQFLDHSPVYIFFKNEQLKLIFLSENFSQLTGKPVTECIGKSLKELLPHDDAEKLTRDDLEIVAKGEPHTGEVEFNGRCYTSYKFPITIHGNHPYLAGYWVDITEQRNTQNILKETVARFQAFMDNMPSMALIKDEQSRLLFYNKEFLRYYAGEEWLGKTPYDIFPPSLADMIVKNDRQALSSGSHFVESEIVDRDGTARMLESRLFAIENEGTPAKLGVIMNDVTARKQAEKALQNSQKLESIGILAGGIAHDFNNLLGGIFGYIDLAHQESTSETSIRYLSKAMATIERARSLTLQLLTFSKGGTPIKKRECMRSVIRDSVQFALSGSEISATLDIQEDIWECDCDRNQICQVIENIVINAVQAMPEGGTIKVTARNTTGDERTHFIKSSMDFIHIAISDSGIGIDEQFLSRIFDPFYTTKPKSHGLGLATCFSILHKHGGSIDVESEPGKGSTFHLFLPALSGSSSVDTISSPLHSGKGLFLILEDEAIIQEPIRAILESFGYTVLVTNNGTETLKFCREAHAENRKITGMIFDLTIPGGMGGKETIPEVRKLFPETPIIVASGYGDDQVIAHPQRYQFSESILKPFTRMELSKVLNKCLRTS